MAEQSFSTTLPSNLSFEQKMIYLKNLMNFVHVYIDITKAKTLIEFGPTDMYLSILSKYYSQGIIVQMMEDLIKENMNKPKVLKKK